MVQAEREVEGRLAKPRAFGIEQDRPFRTDKNVLWANVAVHQRSPYARGSLRQILKP